MAGDGADGGRRFLIATAVTRYPKEPAWDRPELAQARAAVIDLFTGTFGYEHVSDLGLDPTKDQLTSELRGFCRAPERSADDLVVVYVAGHGEVLEDTGFEHVLLTSDTDPGDIHDALLTVDLARKMLADTPVRRVLLLLDTCYSGQGGNDLLAEALSRFTHTWGKQAGSGFVVVTSAQPSEQAEAAEFPSLLSRAVHRQSTAGHAPPALDFGVIVQAMNDDPARPGYQRIGWATVGLSGQIPAFLPNPRHDKRLNGVDLYVQQIAEWEAQADRREVEYRRRFLVRAMGSQELAGEWWFTGRHQALSDIAGWLAVPAPGVSALVVTAGPGSGKTAVLGLVASLADPERRRTVPVTALGLPDGALPPPGSIDVTIYAGGLTTAEVLAGMAAAARVTAATPGELASALEGRQRPFTALVDALDEAADPEDLASRLLRPLLDRGAGTVRLLLGTRPHLIGLLPASARQIKLDEDYADPAALRSYTIRGLLDAAPDSPYPHADPRLVRAVAGQVAASAGSSFLVARITSRTLAEDPRIPDPADAAWRAGLPRVPGDAIRRDLDRLGPDTQRARDLLRPLAYAEGQGLPWEDIWAALASRISGRRYTDEDILWLRKRAGSYIVEAADAGRSAYKLYHQAMAEYLRADTTDTDVHRAFVQVLTSRVPRAPGGTRDWDHAHPYTLRNLATHAAAAGLIDGLVTDMDYLTHAAPDTLLPALHATTSQDAQLTCAIYRASTHVHRHLDPQERRQLLAVDAARYHAPVQLDAARAGLEWQPRWATGSQVTTALHATLTGHTRAVAAVACAALDGRPVAVTGSDDKTVRVWDLATGLLTRSLSGHTSDVKAVACAALDGRPVAVTGSDDKTVRVWDLATGQLTRTLTGHAGQVEAVACAILNGHPIAVTASLDKTARVWDLDTGQLARTLTGHTSGVEAVACAALDGRPVAVTGSRDQTARIWDLATGQLTRTLTGHTGPVAAVACAALDGRPVAVTGSMDGTARVWDLATGQLTRTLTGHTHGVKAVACAALDGRPVAATGSRDQTVRVWDLDTGQLTRTLTGHTHGVKAVACAALDGRPVAVTASTDGTARVWDLDTGEAAAVLAFHNAALALSLAAGGPLVVGTGHEVVVLDHTSST